MCSPDGATPNPLPVPPGVSQQGLRRGDVSTGHQGRAGQVSGQTRHQPAAAARAAGCGGGLRQVCQPLQEDDH